MGARRAIGVIFAWATLACTTVENTAAPESPRATDADAAPSSDGATTNDGAADEPTGAPALRFVGRFDTRDPAGPKCSWPGCRIVARFEGDTISVRLKDLARSWQEANGTNEWDAIVDGETTHITTLRSDTQFDLARGLRAGPHTVELFKRSGPHHGETQFLGFDFHGGKLLAPPAAKTRRIAIVGDSQSYGFGVLGVGTCDNADAAKYEHFGYSYPALVATAFDADVHAVSYPGKGLIQNIWRPDKLVFSALVQRELADDDTSTFDFSTYVPDVVVIQLGSNDYSIGLPTDTPGGPSQTAFQAKLREMVQLHRRHYPQAFIALLISPSASDGTASGHLARTNVTNGMNAIAAEFANAGDERVSVLEPSASPESELTGCRHHGNEAFHRRLATVVSGFIRLKLGW